MGQLGAVASVGDNCIDRYLGADPSSFVGGNAVNVAVGLRSLGRPAIYFGAVGDDADGRRVRAELDTVGVDVDHLRTCADGATGVTRIRVLPDGERVFESEEFGTSATYAPGAADLVALRGYAAVHLGLLHDPDAVRRDLAGGDVLVTQDCAVAAGFAGLDVAFCSEAVAGPARDSAVRAVSAGARLCVVTRGAQGSLAHDGRRWWACPAEPVEVVVDTTGAGDSFIAGFVDEYLRARDVESALRAAARTAALTCGRRGAWVG